MSRTDLQVVRVSSWRGDDCEPLPVMDALSCPVVDYLLSSAVSCAWSAVTPQRGKRMVTEGSLTEGVSGKLLELPATHSTIEAGTWTGIAVAR